MKTLKKRLEETRRSAIKTAKKDGFLTTDVLSLINTMHWAVTKDIISFMEDLQ